MDNNNPVVLITGCSSGIGRELCEVLMNRGYRVVATARNPEAMQSLRASMKLQLDVTDAGSIHEAVRKTVCELGRIDILVNNAGYSIRGALEEISTEQMQALFNVNVFGIIRMTQAVIPEMRKNQSGKIINIGSISGKFTQPINGAYCASKHAVEAITSALRFELHRQNIQTTVIEPGPIRTDFFQTMDVHSGERLNNTASCYADLYQADAKRKEKQYYTSPQKAAQEIGDIIGKARLKPRYEIAVPYAYHMFASFPHALKDYLMRNSL